MKKIFALLTIALLCCSCDVVLHVARSKSAVKKRITLENKSLGKEVILLGIHHNAKEKYYAELKDFVTKAREDGYRIYYEGPNLDGIESESEKKVLYLKLRKLIGFYPDYSNKKTMPFRLRALGGVKQTLENNGIDRQVDVNADMSIKEFIGKVEEKYGEIVLDSCDWKTPMDEKYKCKIFSSTLWYDTVLIMRNKYLEDMVLNSDDKKIVIIYGEGHKMFLLADFRKLGFVDDYVEVSKGKWKK